jgi:glycosidase
MRKRPGITVLGLALAAGSVTFSWPVQAQMLAPDTSWVSRAVLYEVFVQDFSPAGNFRGVLEGLDRIQSAGADVIWLMPIHPIGVVNRKGTLGSPYAARDYRGINPSYGTGDDLRALVEAAHARGMKVILDWVPDHTSPDHAWVKDQPDFYVKDAQGQPSVPRNDKGELTDWTDVVQLDYKNPAVRREMIATMQYWLDQFGIDGFRVDVAGFLPYDFWREAIPALRAATPRPILMLAEWGDLQLHRDGFDLTYGWDSYKRLKAVWKGAPASSFVQGELPDMKAMPPGGMRMRFTTNHDETAWDNPPVAIFGAGSPARAAFLAIAFLPGRPLLYNGQEVESPQKLPLFERELVEWNQPAATEARAFYGRVLQLTRTDPALLSSQFAAVTTTAPKEVIAYRRADLLVLVNARSRAVKFEVKDVDLRGARDVLSGSVQKARTITLPPYGTLVLTRRG